ncbi:GlxA family transcriptional regulator [Cognatishimia sp. WU-CL00825]|uniref:GlxA family transcriptional regulator n=1 Tax=Cognatishimia sp. WU-CL00825 TaxID=3127658 RepID=UPI00310666C7
MEAPNDHPTIDPETTPSTPSVQRAAVSQGVAHVDLPGTYETESYAFVLLPKMSLNAFSAALEPLRIANQLTGKELFRWVLVSEDGQAIACSSGVEISVAGDFSLVQSTDKILVCSGVNPILHTSDKVANWMRFQWRKGQTVGGICTGAYALAKAGILQNSEFTLHWENLAPFSETFDQLEPSECTFVFDNRVWTCAGGIAATDMMIARIDKLFGSKLAVAVAQMCLVNVPRSSNDPQKSSTAATFGIRDKKLLKAVNFIQDNFEEDLKLDELAAMCNVSRRQMERLFKRHLDLSPRSFLVDVRLQQARTMLAGTDLSIIEVATACGFGSTSYFSKRFRMKFGASPYRFRLSSEANGKLA